MKNIGENHIWSFYDVKNGAQKVTSVSTVRAGKGHLVKTFLDLARKVAELQFRNPDLVLMFRGQSGDHLSIKKNTSLQPSIFRPTNGGSVRGMKDVIKKRYEILDLAEKCLIEEYSKTTLLGKNRIQRQSILRWAILQHYEVCPTPLLDITHSLRIAASFASQNAKGDAYIFVLGIPNLSGAITVNAQAGIQVIRLASVCPPSAVRPHIQEGYLLGEYPDLANHGQKELYEPNEHDFGRRLVAKFRFDPSTFWQSTTFPQINDEALYPSNGKDPLAVLASNIKARIGL